MARMRFILVLAFTIVIYNEQIAAYNHIRKREAVATQVKEKFDDFRENCFPRGSVAGCKCTVTNQNGGDEIITFDSDDKCKKPVEFETAENKKKLNEEFNQKYGSLKENCFPRPGKGCRCNEKDATGNEVEKKYETDADCKVKATNFRENCSPQGTKPGCKCTIPDQHGGEEVITFDSDDKCKMPAEFGTAENKKKLNEEFNQKYGGLKENCFPRPGKGCRCNEKDAAGNEVERKYETDADCKVSKSSLRVRRGSVLSSQSGGYQREQDQNVRDPVREKAQQNYAAVINELKDKFRGLREGCFPRPKGCLCVIGKNNEGRDITERRMKDVDCKCKPNERSADCPAPGA